jgi:hypothetical protein
VFWPLGELCCWVHKLLAGSPKPDWGGVVVVKHEVNNLAL